MGAIVLIGPMGAGKTSVGRRVAKRLGVAFTDTDAAVVRVHGPIPEIFASHGEETFRAWEAAAVSEALASGGVVALGGGAVLDPATRAALAAHRTVLLTIDPAVAATRIRGAGRPLLAGSDAVTRWTEIAESRRALYDELADATFDTSRGPIDGIADAVADWVRSAPARPPLPSPTEGLP